MEEQNTTQVSKKKKNTQQPSPIEPHSSITNAMDKSTAKFLKLLTGQIEEIRKEATVEKLMKQIQLSDAINKKLLEKVRGDIQKLENTWTDRRAEMERKQKTMEAKMGALKGKKTYAGATGMPETSKIHMEERNSIVKYLENLNEAIDKDIKFLTIKLVDEKIKTSIMKNKGQVLKGAKFSIMQDLTMRALQNVYNLKQVAKAQKGQGKSVKIAG